MTVWTSQVPLEFTRPFGVEKIHAAMLAPPAWPGRGPVVGLSIPECELQIVLIAASDKPAAIVNRPQVNRNIMRWLRSACDMAIEYDAALVVSADTAEQAERAAKSAGRRLPKYERVALERVYAGNTRMKENLS